MASLRELAKKKNLLTGGHRLCAGCGASITIRQVLLASNYPLVCGVATGCLEVSTTIYPYTAWRCSYIHTAFESVAATISGVEAAYRALKKKGKIEREMKFIAFGGDGGTYDIGFQALSGALERGHRMLYVCYDNQAYMNTGIQRSGATPLGAWTTTTPAGKVIPGKPNWRKDLTACVVAHNIPYVAQASPSHWKDLVSKVEKALETDGPTFINILAPCPRGWRYPESKTIKMAKLAVDSCFWPLYEVEEGKYKLNYQPKEKKPVVEWLQLQGRFKHLFKPENQAILEKFQANVDKAWENLLALAQKT